MHAAPIFILLFPKILHAFQQPKWRKYIHPEQDGKCMFFCEKPKPKLLRRCNIQFQQVIFIELEGNCGNYYFQLLN